MARSGYGEAYREWVIKAQVKGTRDNWLPAEVGRVLLYKHRGWKKEERRKRKMLRGVGSHQEV